MMRMRTKKRRKRVGIELMPLSSMRSLVLTAAFATGWLGQIQAPVTPQAGSGAVSLRSIEGVVIDGSKNPVPSAVVLLKDTKTLQVRSYLAQKDGRYHFYGLSTDINYELRAQGGDLMSKVKTVSVFDSHAVVKLDLKLNKKKKL